MSAFQTLAWSPFDPWHLLFFGVIALLLFGRRLPEVGRSLGRGISEFKKGLKDVGDELNKTEEEDRQSRLSPPREAAPREAVRDKAPVEADRNDR